jgi:4-amino-4-deoxy-L-arabinose transferase-like glycosyltransferase
MDRKERFKNEKAWLFLGIILTAAVRIFFLLNCENMPGTATDAVVRALRILEDPRLLLNFDGNRSTLFNYALASFLFFWRDPVLAPRAFALIFGVFLVLPYYGTLKSLFDRRIAFFSSLVLVFCPLHVIQSGTATADTAFYFFLFSAFYYFFKFKDDQKRTSAFWLSVFLFNIASLMRFESWLFIPLFFILLRPKGKEAALRFLILSSVFPCIWLLLNQIRHYAFLTTFQTAAMTAREEIAAGTVPYDPRVFSWIVVLWRSSGASLVIGGLSGIVLAFVTRQKRQLAIFFLVLLSAFTVNSCAARMWHAERYSILLALLLIPYAWFFASKALACLGDRKALFLICFLIFPAVDIWQIVRKPDSTLPFAVSLMHENVTRVAQWLKTNVRQNETLVIGADRCDVLPDYIVLRAGITPLSRCFVAWTHAEPRFNNKKAFEMYIWEHRTSYLVLNSGSYLQRILNLEPNKKSQDFGEAVFELAFEANVPMSGRFVIYRISYRKFPGSGGNA